MLILKIAWRNIFRHKRRSLLTGLLMAGGCLMFCIYIGIADGTYSRLIDLLTRNGTGHFQIHRTGYLDKPTIYKRLPEMDKIKTALSQEPSVVAWSQRIHSPALAFAGTRSTGIRLVGIEPVSERKVTFLHKNIKEGRFISDTPSKEIVLTPDVARVLRVTPGMEIAIISSAADGSIANDLYRVVGLSREGSGSYVRGTGIIHMENAREFLSLTGSHEVVAIVGNQGQAREAATSVQARLKALGAEGLEVSPWQEVEKQFYQAMQADLKGHSISMIVFVVIIAVGVLNTVLMMILERTREFGVMRALGTRPAHIFSLIVTETLLLSAISSALGVLSGTLLNYYFKNWGIALPTPLEFGGMVFDRIRADITLQSLYLPPVIILTSSLIVCLLPALRAARITPVEAMRST